MGKFKKSAGYKGGSHGRGTNRRTPSDRPRYGDKGGFSRSGDAGGRDSRPQMYSAVCSQCNRACEVPFRSTGVRPVFCKDCFNGKRESSQSGYSRRDAPSRNSSSMNFTPADPVKPHVSDKRIDDLKKQLDAVHKKLDAIMEMMEGDVAGKVKINKSAAVKK
ncbi:MAG: CxxC-x17-CxxC domain-containing protein [Patescibacteria group bacterium]